MKRIYSLILLMLVFFTQACQDEVNMDKLSYPPSILSMTPGKEGKVPIGGFDLKVVLVDGVNSPLASASVVITDAADNEVVSASQDLSGIKDSIFVAGETFGAEDLGEGEYTLYLEAIDTKGQKTTLDTKFTIVNALFASLESIVYVAGEFNGWGATEMELVSDYTWELKDVNLGGGKFKFKNTPDWTDMDWGDPQCDGMMQEAAGVAGTDTDCGYSGKGTLTFNDKTLQYSFASDFKSTVSNLYLLGSINDYQGADYKFGLVGDNSWELGEVRMKAGDKFKFSEGPEFDGKNFGAGSKDGVAALYGPNIVMPDGAADAYYKITFNDKTLAYTLTIVGYPTVYMVGGALNGWNWDPGTPIAMSAGETPGIFVATVYFKNDIFRFFGQDDWGPVSYNYNYFTSVHEDFELNAGDTDNNLRFIGTPGVYLITMDMNNKTLNLEPANIYIVGAAANGWNWDPGNPVKMTFNAGEYTATTTLKQGETFRFFGQADWGPVSYNYLYFTTVDADLANANDDDKNFKFLPATGSVTVSINFETKTITVN